MAIDRRHQSTFSACLDNLSIVPLPLYCFMFVLFLFLGFSWYLSGESVLEDFFDDLKLLLIVSPLLLLLVVQLLSGGGDGPRLPPFPIPLPKEDSLHRAGGSSPWGVACMLVLVLFLVSY